MNNRKYTNRLKSLRRDSVAYMSVRTDRSSNLKALNPITWGFFFSLSAIYLQGVLFFEEESGQLNARGLQGKN